MLKSLLTDLAASIILSTAAVASAPGRAIPKTNLMAALNSVAAHGLNSADYHLALQHSAYQALRTELATRLSAPPNPM